MGAALQKFITGWEYAEYPKVLSAMVGCWKKMNRSVTPPRPSEVEGREYCSLRRFSGFPKII